MKKIIKFAAATAMLAVMCASMTACGGGQQTFHEDGGTGGSYQHNAVSGCRVEIQDGGASYMYRMLCDSCGQDLGTYAGSSTGGTHTEDHACPNCGETVHVVINTTVK